MTAIYFGILVLVLVCCGVFVVELDIKRATCSIVILLCFTTAAFYENQDYLKERKHIEWRSQFANAIVV